MKTIKYLIVVSLLSFFYHVPSFATVWGHTLGGKKVKHYQRLYTPYKGSRATHVHKIFQHVRKVVDKHPNFLTPKLYIFKNIQGGRKYWAKALPDGNILLWKAAIDACYQNVQSADESNARLAFILGHELGHLANDDYGYLKRPAQTNLTQARKEMELRADKEGYTYASLSGYKVKLLLENRFNNKNFLTNFLANTRSHGGYHPIRASVKALQGYLKKVQSKLTFFNFGIRLSHFDRCDDGKVFLEEFKETFSGREVLNNLGFCYLQQARQQMERERANLYWMPQILDVETRATGAVMGAFPLISLKQMANSPKGNKSLRQAEKVLKKAQEADIEYIPARLNLAVTYLYLGQPTKAHAILQEARQLASDSLEVQSLQALAMYEQNSNKLDSAIMQLQSFTKQPVPTSMLFNLARLLEMGNRSAEASIYWKHLAGTADILPKPIREIVCQQQQKYCRKKRRQPQQPLWRWDEITRINTWGTPLEKKLSHLKVNIYQHPNRQIEVLKINDELRMQVIKDDNFGTVADLQHYCEQPLRQRNIARGILKSCGGEWAALAYDNQVREIWRYVEVTW